jgi:hypothetical protein
MQPITPRIKIFIYIYFRGNFFKVTPFRVIGRLNNILNILNLNIKKKPSLKFLNTDLILYVSNLIFKNKYLKLHLYVL